MSLDSEALRVRAPFRRWPLLLALPLLAVVAWPRPPAPTASRATAHEALRVAYPQVRILGAAEFEALRGRCFVIDVATGEEHAAVALATRVGGAHSDLPVIFRAPRARAALALEAALRARVAGCENACAYLVD